MSRGKAVVLDLETTGLNPRTDKIIEIGALLVEDGEILDTFSTFVSPGRKLLPQTTEITGITDEMLEHAPVFADIAEKLLAFLGEHVLLGHSIISDYAFLKKALVNEQPKGFAFERNGLDTLKIARRFLPAEQKKALSALTAYFQIPHEPHRALADAQATFLLYEKLWDLYEERAPSVFTPFPLHYQIKREVPVMPKQIEQIRRLLEERGIPCDRDLSQLTKNEASRLADQIRSGVIKAPSDE